MKKDLPVHILNAANGCVYVDRKNKNSRTKAKRKLLMLLKEGHSVLLFPEGTWNLTSSKLILPLNWGMLDLSAISGVPIVPIGLVYSSQKRVVNFGNAISCSCEDVLETERRIETLQYIEEILGTLIWKGMEQSNIIYRKRLPKDIYKRWRKQTLNTYKKFDVEYEQSVIRDEN